MFRAAGFALLCTVCAGAGILAPQDSETRETKSLDGVWNFRTSALHDQDAGFRELWYTKALAKTGAVIPMPVPSSYNDITQNASIQNHIGWAWYDTSFFVPQRWKDEANLVHLRFGSAHYNTMVWLNGVTVLNHSGGHLPFQSDVTKYLKFGTSNLLTVAVNNTLTADTVPQGKVTQQTDTSRYPPGYMVQTYAFDFFNYAGIHRPVVLYTVPKAYIDDITVTTNFDTDLTGLVHYTISAQASSAASCEVELEDKEGNVVAQETGLKGKLYVPNAHLWWPHTMSKSPGYLYSLKVKLIEGTTTLDIYRLRIGIRTVKWTNTSLLINDKPFYFRGLGKHEDSDIRGKGLDYAVVIKDFNLLKWLGANSFRTSHYPYAEEIMDQADEQGIVVIDECPAVSLDGFGNALLKQHLQAMKEMVQRDKNRPSVILWSVGNEPRSDKAVAGPYFKQVVEQTKEQDPSRPVTLITAQSYQSDKAAQYMDLLGINRYYGWYQDTGHLEVIMRQVITEFTHWHNKFNKPVFISEYGADTIAGLHTDPPFVFSEDYQSAFMYEYFMAFDYLRKQGYFVGEMIWNFADFMTAQGVTRVVGNKKGVFTRERQPKMSARLLRTRYWALAEIIDHYTCIPPDARLVCPANDVRSGHQCNNSNQENKIQY